MCKQQKKKKVDGTNHCQLSGGPRDLLITWKQPALPSMKNQQKKNY